LPQPGRKEEGGLLSLLIRKGEVGGAVRVISESCRKSNARAQGIGDKREGKSWARLATKKRRKTGLPRKTTIGGKGRKTPLSSAHKQEREEREKIIKWNKKVLAFEPNGIRGMGSRRREKEKQISARDLSLSARYRKKKQKMRRRKHQIRLWGGGGGGGLKTEGA